MKLSNFQLKDTTKNNVGCKVFHATVDITTGMLWWKKVKTVKLLKIYMSSWHYVETGYWAPSEVNAMARAWTARTGQEC